MRHRARLCCRTYLLLQFLLGIKRSSLFRHRIGGGGSQLVHLSTQARGALFVSLSLVHRLLQAGDQALCGIELTLSSAGGVSSPFSHSRPETSSPERAPSPIRSPAEYEVVTHKRFCPTDRAERTSTFASAAFKRASTFLVAFSAFAKAWLCSLAL